MSAASHSWVIIVTLCLFVLLAVPVADNPGPEVTSFIFTSQQAPVSHPELCAIIETGLLADLRWPDFSGYRAQVKNFYQSANCSLAWFEQGRPTPRALAMISLLQNAGTKGLQAEDYDGLLWAERLARVSQPAASVPPSDLQRFDLALTVSVMRYISDLHQGRLNPRRVRFDLKVEAREHNLAEFVRALLLVDGDVRPAIEGVEPQSPGYRRALNALERYLILEKEGDGPLLPVPKKLVKSIKPGDTYPDAPQLAQRLRQLGDLPKDVVLPTQPGLYDGALVEAVKHFQRRHGLPDDGAIGAETVKQLNTPLSQRVMQLQFALERWRWLPHDLPSRLVVINIPEFRLRGYEEHHATITMSVIVGQHFHNKQTPVFQDEMEYVIFNPYWNVPVSIARNEMIPSVRKDPGYLEQHHFEIVNHRGEALAQSALDDELTRQLRAGTAEFRQRPGTGNALGAIKFVFPNQYDVYLHGTPEKRLFARARRDFSHGCMRVEDPSALAAWVLRDDPSWTSERIQKAVEAGKTLQVNLPKSITVLVLYGTAFVEEDGEIRFFEDIYGHDATLQALLAKGRPYPE
ncbi:MAG: L,D-transpeptidase family protein [Acidobacteriia bacterium]|nr:L,D-transpeptidase family protein [Terriglobia bacterium]